MSIAAGRKIKQTMVKDRLCTNWLPGRTTAFNVQVLNSAAYKAVTGEAPPAQPVDAEEYAQYGLPLYNMHEESSRIHGDFGAVKSIAKLLQAVELLVRPKVVSIGAGEIDVMNSNGPLPAFRATNDLVEDVQRVHVASF